jgi:hypothetical protein
MKLLIKVLVLLFITISCYAQDSYQDVVYLKNGSIIRGTIVEQVSDKMIKIQIADESILVYKIDEVDRIAREPIPANLLKNPNSGCLFKRAVTASVGLSLPSGHNYFSDSWNTGLNVGVGYNMPIKNNLFITTNFDFNSIPLNNDKFKESYISGSSINGGTTKIISITCGIQSRTEILSDKIDYYLGMEAGLFSLSVSDIKIDYSYSSYKYSYTVSSESEKGFQVLFGAGVEYVLSEKMNLLLGFKYGVCLTKNENTVYIPVKAGLSYNL